MWLQATGYRLQDKRQVTHSRLQGPSCSLQLAARSLVCVLLLVLTGCVRQQLSIRSEPPGAELLLNDQLAGLTPCTYDFLWYGWYRVTLTKSGYERLEERVLIKAPWYLWTPLDLVMELWPLTVRDTKEFSFQLRPEIPLPEPIPPPVSRSEGPSDQPSADKTGGGTTPPVRGVPADHGKTTQANGGT